MQSRIPKSPKESSQLAVAENCTYSSFLLIAIFFVFSILKYILIFQSLDNKDWLIKKNKTLPIRYLIALVYKIFLCCLYISLLLRDEKNEVENFLS